MSAIEVTGRAFAAGMLALSIFARAAKNVMDAAEICDAFVKADTAQIQNYYSDFFFNSIVTQPFLAEVMEAHVAKLKAGDLDPLYKAQRRRWEVLPALVAVHQYPFLSASMRQKLVPHVLAALKHPIMLVREILMQNMISSVTAGTHYIEQAKGGELLIQNPEVRDAVLAFFDEALVKPEYVSPLNSLTIYLANMAKILAHVEKKEEARELLLQLNKLNEPAHPGAAHLALVYACYDWKTPLTQHGEANIYGLSPQPTEALFGWRNLADAGVSRDYLFWLAVERLAFLQKSVEGMSASDEDTRVKSGSYVAKILGLYRPLDLYNGLMREKIKAGALEVIQDMNPSLYNFLTMEIESVLNDAAKYPAEQNDPGMMSIMRRTPLSRGRGTNMLSGQASISGGRYFERVEKMMAGAKMDPGALTRGAGIFFSELHEAHNSVTGERAEQMLELLRTRGAKEFAPLLAPVIRLDVKRNMIS